ncbi:MAG: hypothetical protein ABIN18_00215 [Pseudomonadota bacterium]
MERDKIDQMMIAAIKKTKGIVEACPFPDKDRQMVLQIEQEAEERGLMGLGKVTNSGVREVLNCSTIYVALTDMDFNWGSHPSLVLKKGQEVIGEEVRDNVVIARLSDQKNVWFMHDNFVIYKNKCSFPRDIMKKVCHFDIPCIPLELRIAEDDRFRYHPIIYANPATLCDTYLKEKYFRGVDQKGLGTILVGAELQNKRG